MKLVITDATVSLGGQEILSHFDFEIKGGEKIALVGRNGSGKTTLLKLLAGELTVDRDDKRQKPAISRMGSFTVGLLDQHVFAGEESRDLTVEEILLAACPCKDTWDRERFAYEQEYDRLFTGFGFTKEDKTRKISQFSGGQRTRIALIRLLLEKPDLLLLDEPTNHLDTEMTEWLEEWIRTYEKAVIMVSHDRYFLDETAQIVYEIKEKRLFKYVGNYSAYVSEKMKTQAALKKAWEREQEEIKRLEDLISRFKNKPKKASFARSRKKILERMEHMEKPSDEELRPFKESIVPDVMSGKYVLEAEDLVIGYDHALLGLSLRIRRGQKIGVIGPNGIGKSTFLKTAAGQLSPIKGKVIPGIHVTQAYFEQSSADFSSDQTVIAYFREKFPHLTDKDARSVLGRWMFAGKAASKKISELSGGERSRLLFCCLFQECPNFMILDEPTNHMDIPAREMLESAFTAYTGTILFVSHDRYFISQVADSLLVFSEEGTVYYPFGYRHYKHRRGRELQGGIPAVDKKLLDEVKNVPEPEKGRLKKISDHALYTDWRLSLMEEDLEKAGEAAGKAQKRLMESELALYEENEQKRMEEQQVLEADLEKKLAAWTGLCLAYNEFCEEVFEEDTDESEPEAEDENDSDRNEEQ